MKSKSIKGKSLEEIKDALQQSLSDGYKPTLAFVFLSQLEDVSAISEMMDAAGI
ncbi:MAG: hypothetical protein H0V30_05850, partial [Chitinophagaceae bacterium]|nr:hypothetical protein [Chitinophagaceae bacterium]